MITARAPGKVILVGEHAVVYGRPAIAVPVWETTATATVTLGTPGRGCVIYARDLDRTIHLAEAAEDDPLAVVARETLAHLGLCADPDWQVELISMIPLASGMGSGAAVSAALARGLFAMAGQTADAATISRLVYRAEQIFHGTPSGIDNTAVAYGKPVWFVKGESPVVFTPAEPFMLVVADSGTPGLTKQTVAGVRARWSANPARYEAWFDEIADLVWAARAAIEQGAPADLGPICDQNHAILQKIGVSTPQLDALVEAARGAGAAGAKLSGGGGGGNIIALVDQTTAPVVRQALLGVGAPRVILTTVSAQAVGVA